ncbi:MAG: D-aminoacyl-tRNA deacylase [Planctomycetota bacterium]|nr:D-aminoacyl-tRNA deacylase [Pirellulaceae bacterium]MDP7376764.1 D-aminoacyl-tRNA deacylase [Pirellulaceae bacterium]MEC8593164.1 D-aminoacyl-tRNA deacylase [Planctomycetota bacterium]MEC8863309.1 D-aminoacyl-tRNA deacylase [Planctomycetota bacterium]MED5577114.1 D-aminoacyl-tRNA deacylase [Planctomycetota bacterium]
MRALIQRVTEAGVQVEGQFVSQIQHGMLVFLGVEDGDTERDVDYLAGKVAGLRIFDDSEGKMNLCVSDVAGQALVVSQFTLLGDCRKGRRPSYVQAAPPELGNELYEAFCDQLRSLEIPVKTGRFRTNMAVHLVNDGPVTLMVDSRKVF